VEIEQLRSMTDTQLDLLADRYLKQRMEARGISFETYLSNPRRFDGRDAMGQSSGGICAWCERWWSRRAGGLNEQDICPECARRMARLGGYHGR